jgi:hypothetical protein
VTERLTEFEAEAEADWPENDSDAVALIDTWALPDPNARPVVLVVVACHGVEPPVQLTVAVNGAAAEPFFWGWEIVPLMLMVTGTLQLTVPETVAAEVARATVPAAAIVAPIVNTGVAS